MKSTSLLCRALSSALICIFLSLPLYASTPKDFGIGFEFSRQGAEAAVGAEVILQLSNLPEYQSGTISYQVEAFPYVIPSSNADDLIVSGNLALGVGSDVYSEAISVLALADGEYHVRVKVNLQTMNNRELFRSKAFAVISQNGVLWFGFDSIDNAVRAKIDGLNRDQTRSLGKEGRFDSLFQNEMKNRSQLSRGNQKKTSRVRAASPIKSGDALSFDAKWVGPNSAGVSAEFPVHGAKIKIQDKSIHDHDSDPSTPKVPISPDIDGYVVNGKFDFVSPRDNYTYTITVESKFPGIKADGSIDTSGNGIGSFDVRQHTATGSTYKVNAPDDSTSHVFSVANIGGLEASVVWAAFHGMAEMVLQAKTQLQVDKAKAFSVIFADTGSFYSPSTGNVSILLDDRYDWDVVAHEFGHAIADELSVVNSFAGGDHDGSNQYDYRANGGTYNKKKESLNLAFNEGFGTWFGTTLLTRSSFKGRFENVGDKTYDDTIDGNSTNLELNSEPSAFGEDTEVAIHNLLWDFYDSLNEPNIRATCGACKDNINLGLKGVWDILNGSSIENISDFWNKALEKSFGAKMSDFLITGDLGLAGKETALTKALDAGDTFAEFGISPYLSAPASGTELVLIDKLGPTFTWEQKKTGTLALSKFTLLLYSADKKTLVYNKSLPNGSVSYQLNETDMGEINAAVDNLTQVPNALIAVIMGEDDSSAPSTGPYFGNAVDLLLQPYNRAVVLTVDSSGSNSWTDPSNLRIVAAKQTIYNLRSKAEADTQNKAPDLAGVIDFDGSATVLSSLGDPDAVVSSVDLIDSSGGTDIAAGINTAVSLLTDTSAPGLGNLVKDRASIIVFTDGENNDGPGPVILAIVNATLKGIRVHLGFLKPSSITRSKKLEYRSYEMNGDPITPEYLMRGLRMASPLPATIEEAILLSGGVYGVIGSAESQVAFIAQLESAGLTNADNTDTGGKTVAGNITTTDQIVDPSETRSFIFQGELGEVANLIVNTSARFTPILTVYNDQGKILLVDRDDNDDGIINVDIVLPYKGAYVAEVFSENGLIGMFTFFAGVANVVNTPPVAVNDFFSVFQNRSISTPDVTLNDVDDDGDRLTVTLADKNSTKGGVVIYNNDNTFRYSPPLNFIGQDTFTYTVSDGNASSIATVTVLVRDSSYGAPVAGNTATETTASAGGAFDQYWLALLWLVALLRMRKVAMSM